jgi:hypothetical protein
MQSSVFRYWLKGRIALKKAGFVTLGVTVAGVALLFVIWLVLMVLHIGGTVIHLLLLLAILLGFIGGLAGIILLVLGRGKQLRPPLA